MSTQDKWLIALSVYSVVGACFATYGLVSVRKIFREMQREHGHINGANMGPFESCTFFLMATAFWPFVVLPILPAIKGLLDGIARFASNDINIGTTDDKDGK